MDGALPRTTALAPSICTPDLWIKSIQPAGAQGWNPVFKSPVATFPWLMVVSPSTSLPKKIKVILYKSCGEMFFETEYDVWASLDRLSSLDVHEVLVLFLVAFSWHTVFLMNFQFFKITTLCWAKCVFSVLCSQHGFHIKILSKIYFSLKNGKKTDLNSEYNYFASLKHWFHYVHKSGRILEESSWSLTWFSNFYYILEKFDMTL